MALSDEERKLVKDRCAPCPRCGWYTAEKCLPAVSPETMMSEPCLCVGRTGIYHVLQFFSGSDTQWWFDGSLAVIPHIVHWRPLPALPMEFVPHKREGT